MTVVEAIKQVWSRIKASRIIVAAPSNAAADLLTSRLVGDIPKSDILRLLSATREGIEIDSAIADVCVFGKIRVGRLMKYRIVIVTLATSSKLVNAQLELGHFSHLFIDEAGQSTETECLIPMAGLLASTGNVVLSGDPCQLGPVVTSKLAEKHGYAMSLLERLMTTQPLYMRDANGNREPKCITKLLRNFRSHSKLLTVPSEMFYDNELIPCADKNETESLCKMSWIPKQGFPIVFHGVRNLHEKEGPSHSLFNEKEVTIVLNYVHRLSKVVDQHSIGIVSPYR